VSGTSVVGVDFSGAREPGESVWIAETTPDGDDLRVDRCRSARTALGASERADVLGSLVEYVDGHDVVGLDFPFGLPRPVTEVGPGAWRETVRWVGKTFDDAEAFAEHCTATTRRDSGGERTYVGRETDGPVGAKSPYHFFTYKQAFHGMRDVLGPLLDRGASVAPMTGGGATTAGTTVVEVYPAGTLRRLGLPDRRYKDASHEARRTRETILAGLEGSGEPATGGDGATSGPTAVPRLAVGDDATRERVLSDAGGDALDAVLAAVAAARALDRGFEPVEERYDPLEGYVFV